MGLMAHIRRLHYVWSWRARYWWLDTRGGEIARRLIMVIAGLVCILEMIDLAAATWQQSGAGQPYKAFVWWVQLIIMVIAAAISYAMRPKPQPAQPQSADAPTVEDGIAVKHYFGTCWIGDEFILAWKNTGTIAIRTKGGKK